MIPPTGIQSCEEFALNLDLEVAVLFSVELARAVRIRQPRILEVDVVLHGEEKAMIHGVATIIAIARHDGQQPLSGLWRNCDCFHLLVARGHERKARSNYGELPRHQAAQPDAPSQPALF